MTRKRRRLWIVVACGLGLGSATALGLSAFSSSLVFFMLPSDVLAKHPGAGQMFRLGGLVKAGSLRESMIGGKPAARFQVTDGKASVPVSYVGVLPDLFREGQGIVALGHMAPDGHFRASEVLAKHSANYMPKDIEMALKKRGLWNPAKGPPPPASVWNDMQPGKSGG